MRTAAVVVLCVWCAVAGACARPIGDDFYTSPATALAAMPMAAPRFSVDVPAGCREAYRYDIGEASEGTYECAASGAIVRIALLLFTSPEDTLAAERRRMRRCGWIVRSLDEDDAGTDGVTGFAGSSPTRRAIVRAMRPEQCPGSVPCAVLFEGRWDVGDALRARKDLERIVAGFSLSY